MLPKLVVGHGRQILMVAAVVGLVEQHRVSQRRGIGRLRHSALIAVNGVSAAVDVPKLGGGVIGALELGRGLLRDLNDQIAAGPVQAGNQHHMTDGVGVQRVAQLELVGV